MDGMTMRRYSGWRLKGRLVVPNFRELKREILGETHETRYFVCIGTKMYRGSSTNFIRPR